MPVVRFFFDCGSAASYLAWVRLAETALRTGATVDWCPVLPEDLPDCPPPGVAEARYLAKDLADWARFCGVPLQAEGAPPAAATAAALVLASLQDRSRVRGALDAWFAGVHGGAGPDLAALAAAAGPGAMAADADARATLAANAQQLATLGGWRAPAFAVGTTLFVGHERLSLVELALTQASDRRIVPPGAHSQTVVAPGDPP
jgi:2-hydroxychromene-2-carboxylate isomerase